MDATIVKMVLGVLIALTPVVYGFTPQTRLSYDVSVAFDGFIPILGGQQGKVDVRMGVGVSGLASEEGNLRAASEIVRFKLSFNGAELPLTLESVQSFFPRTTITLTPQGQILKSDAPDVKLPVKLPGLDVKRFPDITYLPIEFPKSGIEVKTPWEFRKSFGGSDVAYRVTASEITDAEVKMDIELTQRYDLLEDDAKEIVTNKADAVNSVSTEVKGTGKAVFDRKLGALRTATIEATAISDVTELESQKKSQRSLKTKLEIKLR